MHIIYTLYLLVLSTFSHFDMDALDFILSYFLDHYNPVVPNILHHFTVQLNCVIKEINNTL